MGVRGWTEVSSGFTGALTLEAAGGTLGSGVRLTRSFKILFEQPSDIQTADVTAIVGVTIGDPHPLYPFCICDTVDFKPDSESRLCWIVTANYSTSNISLESGQSGNQQQQQPEEPDPRQLEPDSRYANWTTSTTTTEVPAWQWYADMQNGLGLAWQAAVNPANDMYDGITMLQPIVNISVEQYVKNNPAYYSQNVGKVNSNQGTFAGFNMFPHSVLFRGCSQKPHTERRRGGLFRGWAATFEFSYKPNWIGAIDENGNAIGYVGWDIVVPITGYNIINDGRGNALVEQGALTLELSDDTLGIIKGWPNAHALQPGTQGSKTRANVLVAGAGLKASQRPSASPVPLNRNGTPRAQSATPKVLFQRASLYQEFDFQTLQLRFRS